MDSNFSNVKTNLMALKDKEEDITDEDSPHGCKDLSVRRELIPMRDHTLSISEKKILIVDDQIFNIDALRIILEMVIQVDVDCVCEKALNGEEALQMVQENV